MPELDELRSRISAAREIASIVRTMKVLAAVSARQYEKALEPLQLYEQAIEDGLCMLLSQRREVVDVYEAEPAPVVPQRVAVVALGSDQGLCGRFNHEVARRVAELLGSSGVPPARQHVVVAGHRLVLALEQAGVSSGQTVTLPSTADGIVGTVGELLLALDAWGVRGHEHCHVIFNRAQSAAHLEQVSWRLLPIPGRWLRQLARRSLVPGGVQSYGPGMGSGDGASPSGPAGSRTLPHWTLPWDELFSTLLQQVLFIALFRALAWSLAAENEARLMAMQAAEKHTEEHLEAMQRAFRQERQSTITRELLDIVAGYEAAQDQRMR
jgi:F-type H+-transporting ATPase subunit gamma